MTTFRKIISIIIITLGVVHISFAFPLYDYDINTLWFMGTGLAIVFAGFINIISINSISGWFTKILNTICNVAMFMCFLAAIKVLSKPQVYVGITLFLITTLISIFDFLPKKDLINKNSKSL